MLTNLSHCSGVPIAEGLKAAGLKAAGLLAVLQVVGFTHGYHAMAVMASHAKVAHGKRLAQVRCSAAGAQGLIPWR